MSVEDATLRRRLRFAGAAILAAGLLSAAAAFLATLHARAPSDPIGFGQSKKDQYEMERIAGKSLVLATDIDNWIGSLWHGRRLACTLVFLSAGGSLLCFFLAHRLSDPPPLKRATPHTEAGGPKESG
jgi:hypothetical protein